MSIEANIEKIQKEIEQACERCGREPSEVTLVAVSKFHPWQAVCRAADAGVQVFGESRVQEAKLKISQCPPGIRWQLVGHLQSNKCRDAVQLFEMIQSVDSASLAEQLNKAAQRRSVSLPVLLEVNVAGEASKFGYSPQALLENLLNLNELSHLEIHGLMAIPPWTPQPEKARRHFQKLADLKKQCEDILGAPLPVLSMGMSSDFAVAIEEGSTMIRVGTSIFGERKR
ncbi:MAG: YggS family pyridoxal phosphate-dependent enzyme [Limisphaerales bacterium]|jgi:pyridoxal phosphate enzyme (YggS family)